MALKLVVPFGAKHCAVRKDEEWFRNVIFARTGEDGVTILPRHRAEAGSKVNGEALPLHLLLLGNHAKEEVLGHSGPWSKEFRSHAVQRPLGERKYQNRIGHSALLLADKICFPEFILTK